MWRERERGRERVREKRERESMVMRRIVVAIRGRSRRVLRWPIFYKSSGLGISVFGLNILDGRKGN